MLDEYTRQALCLAINELTQKLSDELTAKNLLAVQLAAMQEENDQLQARVEELEALLDAQTQPAKEGE